VVAVALACAALWKLAGMKQESSPLK